MALIPLKAPLSNDAIITNCCKLYRLSLPKVLALNISLLLVLNFIRFGASLYPAPYAHLHSQIAIFAVVILLILSGTLFCAIDGVAKGMTTSYKNLLYFTLSRFLPFAGCIFSMFLLPALIMGVCVGVYFFLGFRQVNTLYMFSWLCITGLILIAAFIPKLFAPILVFIDNLGANESIDESARLVKGNFFRSFVFCLLAILVVLFFIMLGKILAVFIPELKAQPQMVIESVGQVLLAFIASWSFALLLILKYDLQQRHPQAQPQVAKQVQKPKVDVKMASSKTTSENNEDKYNF